MLKVIIADDEPVIVKGLKKLIPWEEYGLSIIDEAMDGKKLWKKVTEKKPDIVVSDICMPEMTGLEFMARLKQEQIEPHVIFISGYQKFEYVQEAIQLGAVDYILKPVLREAMEGAVKKALLRLRNQERLEIFREEKNELQELLARLNSDNGYAPEELYESFCNMGIDYKGKTFVGICFYLDDKRKKRLEVENYKKAELIKFSVFNRIQNFFRDNKKGVPMKREEDCLYILCMIEPKEKGTLLSDYVLPVLDLVEQEMKTELRSGVGSFSEKASDLGYMYKSAKFAYEMRYFLDRKVICADDIHKKFTDSFEDYERLKKEILEMLVTRRPEVTEKFEECIELIKNLHYGNRYAVINRCILFSGTLNDDLKAYGAAFGEDEKRQIEFMEKMRASITYDELKQEFLDYYGLLTNQIASRAVLWENPAIAQVVNYMKAHFEEDINMRKMAEMACVNSVYFGALFKKTTGRNFKSFLTGLRMDEAKRLVITTDLRTYEIAEKVGYQNTRQFTEKFREYYGCSPAEYKRKLTEK